MRRAEGKTIPGYYKAPLWRPKDRSSGSESIYGVIWDMDDHWPTTGEWLAWVRRRDGGQKKYYGWHGWQYPVRPIIAATRNPWSTDKFRKLV